MQKLFHCLNFQKPSPKNCLGFFKPAAAVLTFSPPPAIRTKPTLYKSLFSFFFFLSFTNLMTATCSYHHVPVFF